MVDTGVQIVFKNDDYIVINKPSGLVVNRSQTTPDETLQDYLEKSSLINLPKDLSSGLYPVPSLEGARSDSSTNGDSTNDNSANDEQEFVAKSGILHRLDKDTSGLMVVARNADSYINIKTQFKNRTVEKVYFGLVLGKIKEKKFEINAPIARDPDNRLRLCVSSKGREALTEFELLDTYFLLERWVSLLKIFPKTGRTHQIRVHCTALGNSIVGDKIYSSRSDYKWALEESPFKRLMLHSREISFNDPKTDAQVKFSCDLPTEFENLRPS